MELFVNFLSFLVNIIDKQMDIMTTSSILKPNFIKNKAQITKLKIQTNFSINNYDFFLFWKFVK